MKSSIKKRRHKALGDYLEAVMLKSPNINKLNYRYKKLFKQAEISLHGYDKDIRAWIKACAQDREKEYFDILKSLD